MIKGHFTVWRHKPLGKTGPGGFTLIELLIVVVIMAIIIGISAPVFIGMSRGAGMRAAVRSVCSTLALVRQWAITHREEVTFSYLNFTAPMPSSCYYVVNAAGIVISQTNALPMDVKFACDPEGSSVSSITFKTDGGLDSGSATIPITIYDRQSLAAGRDVRKTITINGLTGGIRVE